MIKLPKELTSYELKNRTWGQVALLALSAYFLFLLLYDLFTFQLNIIAISAKAFLTWIFFWLDTPTPEEQQNRRLER